MLKIRLMRIGARKRPFYRVVAVDERAKRTGGYIENLGTYNPLTNPKEINLKQDRIDYWIKQGGQMSSGFLRIIGKAPQRKPRKAKKDQGKETPAAETTAPTAAPTPEPVSETPAEQPVEVVTEETAPKASEKSEDLKTSESVSPDSTETPTQEVEENTDNTDSPASKTTDSTETPENTEAPKE